MRVAVPPPLELITVRPLMAFYQSLGMYRTCSDNYRESMDSTKSMIPRFVDSGNMNSDRSTAPLPSSSGPGRGNKILVRTECDSQSWTRSWSRPNHSLRACSSSFRSISSPAEVKVEEASIEIRRRPRCLAAVLSVMATHLISTNPHWNTTSSSFVALDRSTKPVAS
jgi:hypothetical protein